MDDKRTDWFQIELGLRQGCILSPLLFNLFINDLIEAVNNLGRGIRCGNKKISILMFADDIVILAENKKDLEYMLDAVYNYSLQWRIKFNHEKCNVVVFDSKGPTSIQHDKCDLKCTCNHHYRLGLAFIKESLVYRYLGIELDNRLTFKLFKQEIFTKAKSSLNRVWYMGIKKGHLSVKALINLYESLVRSQLEYGSEVWGKDKWMVGEKLQLNMGKKILRCTLHTSNEAIYGDLGWWSLEARRNYKKLVYWYHLETLENNRITKRVYLLSKNNNKSTGWAVTIHKILSLYGLQRLYDNPRNLYNLDGKRNNEAKSITDHCRF